MSNLLKKYIMEQIKEKKEIAFTLKPYSVAELARHYNVKPRTMKNWLLPFAQAIGRKSGRLYTVKQIVIIIQSIGEPPNEFEHDFCRDRKSVV